MPVHTPKERAKKGIKKSGKTGRITKGKVRKAVKRAGRKK